MYTALRMDSVAKPTFNIVRDTREQPDLLDDALDLLSALNLFSCAGGWGGGALVLRAVGHVSVVSDTIVY